jgi:membrane associated rhomboid family serine protease
MTKKAINLELLLYPFLLIITLWVIYWGEFNAPFELTRLGILPRTVGGLSGVLFSPLLHSTNDIYHLINNSFPIYILTVALLYYYKDIAFKVFFLSWILSGILTWSIAKNEGSYHIGISSIIYALVCFLFLSGVLRRQKQLQAVSLLIVFLYGSLVWGVFPMEEKISWQGHLGGSITGLVLAVYYYEPLPKSISIAQEITPPYYTQKNLDHLKEQYTSNSSAPIYYEYVKTQETEAKS